MGERSPEEGARQLLGVTTFFLILITFTTLLRFYVKGIVAKNFGLDDWFAALSLVCDLHQFIFPTSCWKLSFRYLDMEFEEGLEANIHYS